MYTAAQVMDIIGPETPDCDCGSCQAIKAMKALICEQVTEFEVKAFAASEQSGDNRRVSAWMTVLVIAASRLAAQGFTPFSVAETVAHGVEQTAVLNPHLGASAEPTLATIQ